MNIISYNIEYKIEIYYRYAKSNYLLVEERETQRDQNMETDRERDRKRQWETELGITMQFKTNNFLLSLSVDIVWVKQERER